MKMRHQLIEERYNEVFVTNTDQSIKEAKQELLEMIVDHLPKRFPDKFESRDGGIYNKIGNIFVHIIIPTRQQRYQVLTFQY